MIRYCIFLLLSLLVHLSVALSVDVKVSKNPVAVNEDFQLIITVSSDKSIQLDSIELPKTLDPLIVKGSSRSSQSSYSFGTGGGTTSVTNTVYYTLSCEQEGVWEIDPISIKINDIVYKTKRLQVEVSSQVQPSPSKRRSFGNRFFNNPFDMFDLFDQFDQQRPPSKDIDIKKNVRLRAYIPKRKIFIGEMLPLDFFLYKKRGLRMALNIEGFPSIQPEGFWVERAYESNSLAFNDVEKRDGEEYLKAPLVSYFLSPLKTGLLKIDPLKITVGSKNLYQFFSNFQSTEIQSQEISVEVVDLPKQGRGNFTGAVGEFLIDSSLDQKEISKSDILSYKIHFKGRGHVRGIQLPSWPKESDFTVYNILESQKFSVESSFKTFEVLLLAKKPGHLEVPRLLLTTFNPDLKSYVSHELEAKKVFVKDEGVGGSVASSQKFFQKKSPTDPLSLDQERDFQILKAEDISFYENYRWAIWFGFYIFLILILIYRYKGLFIKKTRKDLGKILLRGCTRAMELKNKGRHQEVGLTLLKVIDHIWQALTGTSGRETSVLLEKCPPSVRQELGHSIQHLIQQIEFLSFAPKGSYRWSDSELEQLIKDCELLIQRVLAYTSQ